MIKPTLLLCCLAVMLFACGDASSQDSANDTAAAPASGTTYDLADYDDVEACSLVSDADLIRLAGVSANPKVMDVSNETIRKTFGGSCTRAYLKEGGISYTIYIFDSPEQAKQRFDNFTEDMTSAEQKQAIGDAMGQVKEQAKEDGALQTATEEKIADTVGGAMVGAAPGAQHEAIGGLGEEARYEVNNQQLYVRQGNVVINAGISSYDDSDATRARIRTSTQELAHMVLQAL